MTTVTPPMKREFPSLPRRDYLVAGVAVLIAFAWLFATALRRASHMLLSYDMAYFSQVTWYVRQGENPYSTLRALALLGDHTNYIMWPIGGLTAIFPTHQLLLALQSGSIAVAAGFVYLLARRVGHLRRTISAGITMSFVLFPALHNLNVADFHPESIALPALIGAVYFAMLRRWWLYAFCVAVALACKEDIAIATTLLGLVLAISQRRRSGVITAAVSIAVLAVNLAIVLPHFGGDNYEQAAKFGVFGNSISQIVYSILRHPLTVLDFLTTGSNLATLLQLFGPVLFLCWLSPRWLIPGLPGQVLYMLSSVEAAHTIDYHYNVVVTAFIYVAVVMTLSKKWPSREVATVLALSGLLFWWTYASDATTWFKGRADYAPGAVPAAIREARSTLRPDDSVLATDRMSQVASERRDIYSFNTFLNNAYNPPKDRLTLAQRRDGVDVIMVDTVGGWQWSKDLETQLQDFLKDEGPFQKVFDKDGVLVFRRL